MSRVLKIAALLAPVLAYSPARGDADEQPAPAPSVDVQGDGAPSSQPKIGTQAWSIGEPSAEEQQLLELMNRARMNPHDEGDRIFADYGALRVKKAVDFFIADRPSVEYSRAENRDAFYGYAAKPPFAFNAQLIEAARGHSLQLKKFDQQSHQIQDASGRPLLNSSGNPVELSIGGRITAAGYVFEFAAESVGAYLDDMLHGHAAFAIDYGQSTTKKDSTGQTVNCYPSGRPCLGHRSNLMNFEDDPARDYPDVGIGVVADTSASTRVGPRIVTIDFGLPASGPRVFVTGVVFDDRNDNGFYDVGEGLGGVRIDLDVGAHFAVTSASGGYAIPVDGSPGAVHVTATGQAATPGSVIGTQTVAVDVTDASVKVDFNRLPDPPFPLALELVSTEPVAIDDTAPAESTIEVPAQSGFSDLAGDVDVEVAIDHPAREEITATLVGPTGTEVVLFAHRPAGANLRGVFDASLSPNQALDAFIGQTCVGTWTLRVEDSAEGNPGTLTSWKLRVRPRWIRTLFCHESPLYVTKLAMKNSNKPDGDSLTFTAVIDTGSTSSAPVGVATLRLRNPDVSHAELYSAALPAVAFRRAVNGTSKTTVAVKISRFDLPVDLPKMTAVEVEIAVDDAVLRQTIPLKKGTFNGKTMNPVSDAFHVDSITTKLVAGIPSYTVKGRLAKTGALFGPGTIEMSLGALRFKDGAPVTKLKGKVTTYKSAGALRALTVDAGKGTFAMTVVSSSVNPGAALELSLRLGDAGFFGATTIAPIVSGTSLTY